MAREIAACMNCREPRELAAHGLCFKCYRAEVREQQVDRHNPALRKEHTRLLNGFAKLMGGLEAVKVSKG
jgi:hypothetical protein